ncbi:MAG: TIM barrel protein [Alphaproteobacteria bacterium]|nr:TIM barrel protein [Alphaproteobacteria bacterium]
MKLADRIGAAIAQPRPAFPGLALYSVRRALAAAEDACLQQAAAHGFSTVAARGGSTAWARSFRSRLAAHGLAAPLVILEPSPSPQEQLAAAAVLGARFVTIPSAPVFFERQPDGRFVWKQAVESRAFAGFVAQIPALAAAAQQANIRLLYHFHDLDFQVMDDGLSPYDWLSTRTHPDHLGFHIDTGWIVQARADIPGLLQRLRGRIHAVDLKDVSPAVAAGERGANMRPVGQGQIDFAAMAPLLAAAGAEAFFIENEPNADEWGAVDVASRNLRGLDFFAPARAG